MGCVCLSTTLCLEDWNFTCTTKWNRCLGIGVFDFLVSIKYAPSSFWPSVIEPPSTHGNIAVLGSRHSLALYFGSLTNSGALLVTAHPEVHGQIQYRSPEHNIHPSYRTIWNTKYRSLEHTPTSISAVIFITALSISHQDQHHRPHPTQPALPPWGVLGHLALRTYLGRT